MIGSRPFRKFLFSAALGIAVGAILLAIFNAQYRWLANELVSSSASEHDRLLEASFERRATLQTEFAADTTVIAADTSPPDVAMALNTLLILNDNMTGIAFVGNDGERHTAGNLPASTQTAGREWLPERLLIHSRIVRENAPVGTLIAAFDLEQLQRESNQFAEDLDAKQADSRMIGFAWAGLGTLAVLLLCGAVIWLVNRGRVRRIRQLKTQAEKLCDANFGERLPVSRGDEIGDLAGVFNDLRDKLRSTTHSRDYVDSILSGMNEAIIVTDDSGCITRINKATTHLLGYEEDELLDTNIDFVVNTNKSRSLAGETPSRLPKEAVFESKFAESIPVSYTCSLIENGDSETTQRIYAAQNISERQRAQKRIRYLAQIDPLTKIPNRMQFQHLLQRGIARARRGGKAICLFYIDIDNFKDINDTFGHGAGDTTLETVADRLKSALPKGSVIGRLAGDEFAVIIDNIGADEAGIVTAGQHAQKALNKLADPFFVQGNEVFMTASMGVAYYPKDAANVIDLIRNADAAMYHAKKTGGNLFSYYAPRMNDSAVDRLMTKSKLKRAFERDELLVHYQPKYNLATGEVFGAEALVRWESPERGMILPSEFIPIAEENHLIVELGEWVLDKVCEDFRSWQRTVSSPGRVSVNLSLKQLRQLNFINRINSILRGHEVSPTSLELEITETTLMENPARTIKLLNELYGLGLHLAIDDFGTGYSSLSALQQFPISTLKIDQSFVRNMVSNPDDATIIDTIIQMGKNLKIDVVAEGVETEDQLAFLQKLGCNYVQGMLFGDPMSSDNYLELLLAQADGTDTYRALFA